MRLNKITQTIIGISLLSSNVWAVAGPVGLGALPFAGNNVTIKFVNRTPYSIVLIPPSDATTASQNKVVFTAPMAIESNMYTPPVVALGGASQKCYISATSAEPECNVEETSYEMNMSLVGAKAASNYIIDPASARSDVNDMVAFKNSSSLYQTSTTFSRKRDQYQGLVDALNSLKYKASIFSSDNSVGDALASINSELDFVANYNMTSSDEDETVVKKPTFDMYAGISNGFGILSAALWYYSCNQSKFTHPVEDRNGRYYGSGAHGYPGIVDPSIITMQDLLSNNDPHYEYARLHAKKMGYSMGKNNLVVKRSYVNGVHLGAAATAGVPGAIGLGVQLFKYFAERKEYRRQKDPLYQEGKAYKLNSPTDGSYPLYVGISALGSEGYNGSGAKYMFGDHKAFYVKTAADKNTQVLYVIFDSTKSSPAGDVNNTYDANAYTYLPGAIRTLNLPFSANLKIKNDNPILELSMKEGADMRKFTAKLKSINMPNIGLYGTSESSAQQLIQCQHLDFGHPSCDIKLSASLARDIVEDYSCLLGDNERPFKNTPLQILYQNEVPADASNNPPFIATADIIIESAVITKLPVKRQLNCKALLGRNYDGESATENDIHPSTADFIRSHEYEEWLTNQSRMDTIFLDGKLNYDFSAKPATENVVLLQGGRHGEYRLIYDHITGQVDVLKLKCREVSYWIPPSPKRTECIYDDYTSWKCDAIGQDPSCTTKINSTSLPERIAQLKFGPSGDVKLQNKSGKTIWSISDKYLNPQTRVKGSSQEVLPWTPDPYAKLVLTENGMVMLYTSASEYTKHFIGYDSPYDNTTQHAIWGSEKNPWNK